MPFVGPLGGVSTAATCCCGTFVEVPCCVAPIPEILVATISDVTDCANLDGVQITLTATVGADVCWAGTTVTGGCETQLSMRCIEGGDFELSVGSTACNIGTATATATDCSPFDITFTGFPEGCCTGGVGSEVSIRIQPA